MGLNPLLLFKVKFNKMKSYNNLNLSLVALLSKDPVYRLDSPGSHLNDVQNWKSKLIQMGGANTAYWPNNPTHLPKKVSFKLLLN